MCHNIGCTNLASKTCGGCGCASYCSPECQKQHWGPKGQHKEYCKLVRAVSDRVKTAPRVSGVCYICLESSSDLVTKGCACRGDDAAAHLECMANVELHKRPDLVPMTCTVCLQSFTSTMTSSLVVAAWVRAQSFPLDSTDRLDVALKLVVIVAQKCGDLKFASTKILQGMYDSAATSDCKYRKYEVAKSLAHAFLCEGRYDEGLAMYKVAVDFSNELFPDSMIAVTTSMMLSSALFDAGNFKEAARVSAKSYADARLLKDADSVTAITSALVLCNSLIALKDVRGAIKIVAETLPIAVRVLGPDHHLSNHFKNADRDCLLLLLREECSNVTIIV